MDLQNCQEISSIFGPACSAMNARLITAGIAQPQEDIKSIVDKCKPDVSRIEAKREK